MGNYMKRIKLKKRKNKLRFKRKLVLTSTLVLLLVLGIGYSALSVNLNINGDITVRKYYGDTLYKVLEDEAAIGTYASEYTEDHQDSMAGVGSEKIYYWYADNNTAGNSKANEILDKWNVIFAGYCWQMIRTTDTGGVKLLYNGVPNEGKCNNTGVAQTIGYSKFQRYSNSPGYVGYMYNTVYKPTLKTTLTERVLDTWSLSTSYWYSHDFYWWGGGNRYQLVDPYQINSTADYPNLVGEYTLYSTNQNYAGLPLMYIAGVSDSNMFSINLVNDTGSTHDLNYYNYLYTYGDSYTDNGNGTYTINNPTTVERKDWYAEYGNVGSNKFVCKNAVNNTCSELWYTLETTTTSITYIKVENTKYSKGFTWDGNKYILDNNTSINIWNYMDDNNETDLKNAHYTCWNTSGECTTLSYIYQLSYGYGLYYIDLTNGKSVGDALNEMLSNSDVNQTNSAIKTGIDSWYNRYMTGYTSKLEDTIFCSSRSIRSLGGWNPSGGSVTSSLQFSGSWMVSENLNCTNTTDKFSVSNPVAQLTYPVGLLTAKEADLLNNSYIRKTGKNYWLLTPYESSLFYVISPAGGRAASTLSNYQNGGVRPVISLKPGTEYSSGTGSMADPYIVDTYYYAFDSDHVIVGNSIPNNVIKTRSMYFQTFW